MILPLVKYERIRTTHAKCMALRQLADRIIAMGKKSLISTDTGKQIFWRRKVMAILTTKEAQTKVLTTLSQRFK